MVWPLGTQTDARSVGEPEPASLGLFGGNFQPLAVALLRSRKYRMLNVIDEFTLECLAIRVYAARCARPVCR